MRFNVSPDQLKKLASRVGTHMPAVPHTRLLDVLSHGLGWRDWHELSSQPAEHREGKEFPIPVNATLQGSNSLAGTGFMEYRQQMHDSFASALGPTCPAIADDTTLFFLLDMLGCTDNSVRVVKPVRPGLPSAQIHSGFYRLSLTNQLGLNPDPHDDGKYMSCNDALGVRQCPGWEVDPEENPLAYDPNDILAKTHYSRWLDTVERHSFDEPEYAPGMSREPFCLVCEDPETHEPHGMVMGSWEVSCRPDAPHYTGTLRIWAAAGDWEDPRDQLGWSIPDVVGGAIDAALWGLADCPEAQVTICVLLVQPFNQMREIGQAVFDLLSDRPTLAPCLRAARARLELRELDIRASKARTRLVAAEPMPDVPFAQQGPPLQRRRRGAMVMARSVDVLAEPLPPTASS